MTADIETVVMRIIEQASETLNLTFNISETPQGHKQVNFRHEDKVLENIKFMESYNHIRSHLKHLPAYEGWDLTCQKMANGNVKVLNEGSIFFDKLTLDLVSQ